MKAHTLSSTTLKKFFWDQADRGLLRYNFMVTVRVQTNICLVFFNNQTESDPNTNATMLRNWMNIVKTQNKLLAICYWNTISNSFQASKTTNTPLQFSENSRSEILNTRLVVFNFNACMTACTADFVEQQSTS